MKLIWVKREVEYFFKQDWTGQISLKALDKFDFARKRFGRESAMRCSTTNPSYPAQAGIQYAAAYRFHH